MTDEEFSIFHKEVMEQMYRREAEYQYALGMNPNLTFPEFLELIGFIEIPEDEEDD